MQFCTVPPFGMYTPPPQPDPLPPLIVRPSSTTPATDRLKTRLPPPLFTTVFVALVSPPYTPPPKLVIVLAFWTMISSGMVYVAFVSTTVTPAGAATTASAIACAALAQVWYGAVGEGLAAAT